MPQYKLAPNKAYPSIPTVAGSVENHTLVLEAIRESLAIYERRTGNAGDSFVRLSELEDLGVVTIDQTTNIVVAPDDDGAFIRRDGTSSPTTGEIDFGAGLQVDNLGIDMEISVPISWEDSDGVSTDFLVFSSSFPPGQSPVTDPYFGYVTLLVTAEGATEFSNTFSSDIGGLTWTWAGGTNTTGSEIGYPSTVSAKHGSMAIFNKGATGATFEGFVGPAQNSAECVAALPLNEGLTGEFCVDFWLDPSGESKEQPPYEGQWGNDHNVISSYNTQNANAGSFQISVNNDGRANMIVPTGGGRTSVIAQAGDVYTQTAWYQEGWHHYAFTRESDGEFRCYVDGVLKRRSGEGVYSSQAGVNIQTPTNAQAMMWGCSQRNGNQPNGQATAAYVDSFRVTKGSARYYDGGNPVGTDIFGSTINVDAGIPQGTPGTIGFIVGDEGATYPTLIEGSTITLNAATTASSTLDVTGAVTMASTLDVTGAVTMSSTLGVTGATTLSDTLGVTGATTLSSTLAVTGTSTFSGNVTLDAVTLILDAGTNTATWESDDVDLTLTSAGLTDYNITGFTAIDLDTTTDIEWGDTVYLSLTAGVAASNGDTLYPLVNCRADCDGSDAATSFTDQSYINQAFTFAGNAQLDTAQFKYGTASFLFDGSGDSVYRAVRDEDRWDYATGEVTVECWWRFSSTASAQATIAAIWKNGVPANCQWWVGYYNGGLSAYIHDASLSRNIYQVAWTPTVNQWYHIVFQVRNVSGTMTTEVFVDGVLHGSNTAINSFTLRDITNSSSYMEIGGHTQGSIASHYGWIDDFRMTQAARYTSGNFTPPTAAYPIVGEDTYWDNTQFQANFDGSDGATSFTEESQNAFALTFGGNAQLDTGVTPYLGTASLLLDGTGDYVGTGAGDQTAFSFGSSDFTLEARCRFDSSSNLDTIMSYWKSTGNQRAWLWYYRGDLNPDRFVFAYSTTGSDSPTIEVNWTPTVGVWYHLACVRDGTTIRFYVDGVEQGNGSIGTATIYSTAETEFAVGSILGASGYVNDYDGNIDNVRVTNGVCRYPSGTSFAPPIYYPTQGPAVAAAGIFEVGNAGDNLALLAETSVTIDSSLVIEDATNTDSATFSHDGTDFNTTFVTTTDWNITGITSIQAGTVDADFDAITATSYGGITEANLVDLSAAETITGAWTFDAEIQLTPIAAPTHNEGLVWYDSGEKTLSYYNDEADVTVNVGQENLLRVRNTTGALIANGTPVYINGSTGANLPNVAPAKADALATSRCIGLATHDIENNSNGYITTLGEVRDLDTSGFLAGDVLFLDTATAGTLTNTRPTTGFAVVVGICVVSNVSVGEIKVLSGVTAQRADITAASQNETVTGNWSFQGNLVVTDGTDTATFSHDGTDLSLAFVTTADWNITGLTSEMRLRGGASFSVEDGGSFSIFDSGNTDAVVIDHNGTDLNFTCVNTVDVNFSGNTGLWDFTGGLVQGLAFASTSSSPSSTSGAITFDVANGDAFEVTLTENITSITLTPVYASGKHLEVTIKFIQDATGSWTVTWPGSVKWPGGTAPVITTTLTTGTDIIRLKTWDGGTTWYGDFWQDYQ